MPRRLPTNLQLFNFMQTIHTWISDQSHKTCWTMQTTSTWHNISQTFVKPPRTHSKHGKNETLRCGTNKCRLMWSVKFRRQMQSYSPDETNEHVDSLDSGVWLGTHHATRAKHTATSTHAHTAHRLVVPPVTCTNSWTTAGFYSSQSSFGIGTDCQLQFWNFT